MLKHKIPFNFGAKATIGRIRQLATEAIKQFHSESFPQLYDRNYQQTLETYSVVERQTTNHKNLNFKFDFVCWAARVLYWKSFFCLPPNSVFLPLFDFVQDVWDLKSESLCIVKWRKWNCYLKRIVRLSPSQCFRLKANCIYWMPHEPSAEWRKQSHMLKARINLQERRGN